MRAHAGRHIALHGAFGRSAQLYVDDDDDGAGALGAVAITTRAPSVRWNQCVCIWPSRICLSAVFARVPVNWLRSTFCSFDRSRTKRCHAEWNLAMFMVIFTVCVCVCCYAWTRINGRNDLFKLLVFPNSHTYGRGVCVHAIGGRARRVGAMSGRLM